ncbi:dimethyl sulfoxide reductase anchor subunit family protein [Entomohabitans teleogrylli]|uniref:dimethyl sulfoxide reductase anchor subunit family protein n=1 Tax=Entomohabitans teleogrylli TaxID=1384589 RepID=UPI00073D3C11|nr:DmsC/YnfH family molybdoenzyme membrane anchor subunit [Entomohabitans teleogrylli]
MHELPLVFFTVLCQSAVGAFVVLLIAHLVGQMSSRQLAVGLFSAMCLFGVGLAIGMFHLGQLLRAFNLFAGIGRSPMSNEIAFSALFGSVGGLTALGLLTGKGSPSLLRTLAWVAAALGLAFVAAIPTVYQSETVAAWRTEYTWVVMLLTVLTGGGLIAAVLGAGKIGLWVSVTGMLLSLLIRPSYLSVLWQADHLLVAAQTVWFGMQILLLLAALVGALFTLQRGAPRSWIYGSMAAIVISEVLGRIAFYNLWAVAM